MRPITLRPHGMGACPFEKNDRLRSCLGALDSKDHRGRLPAVCRTGLGFCQKRGEIAFNCIAAYANGIF
jgi:hypothetical protein